jgi:hypothetical protein
MKTRRRAVAGLKTHWELGMMTRGEGAGDEQFCSRFGTAKSILEAEQGETWYFQLTGLVKFSSSKIGKQLGASNSSSQKGM